MPAPNTPQPIQNDFSSSGQIQPDVPKTPYDRPFTPIYGGYPSTGSQSTVPRPSGGPIFSPPAQQVGMGMPNRSGGFSQPDNGMGQFGQQGNRIDRGAIGRPVEQGNPLAAYYSGFSQPQMYGMYNTLNQNAPPNYRQYLPQLPGWAGYLMWLQSGQGG